jgi:hypothetical protein
MASLSQRLWEHTLLHQPIKMFVSSADAAQQQLAKCYNQTFGAEPPPGPPQSLEYNCTDYMVPHYSLLEYAESHPYAVLNWPNSSYPVPGPGCGTAPSGTNCACYVSTVQQNLQGDAHGAIPNLNGSTRHRECGICGSRVYVYVHNCFTDHDAAMIVRVNLEQLADVPHNLLNERCYTRRDQVSFDLLAVSICFMAACVAAFLLPLGVSVVVAVFQDLRSPAQSKKVDGKG